MRMLTAKLRTATAWLVALLAIGILSSAQAQDLIRVEEDWELVIREPGPLGGMPQVTTCMTPYGSLTGVRWLFTINLDGDPQGATGGMRLLGWDHDVPGPTRLQAVGRPLKYRNERITWTQVLTLERGVVTCTIEDGESQSFGTFGGQQALSVSMAVDLRNLNDYSQWGSFFSSGISGRRLTPTRVDALVLQQVRWYSAAGLEFQDNEPKPVYVQY